MRDAQHTIPRLILNLLTVLGGWSLVLWTGGVFGACDTADTRSEPDDQTAVQLERCLPHECSVDAVRMADEYVGSCTEEWRERREVRAAQRARGIPDETP